MYYKAYNNVYYMTTVKNYLNVKALDIGSDICKPMNRSSIIL